VPKRSRNKQGPEDLNESAFRVIQEATREVVPKTDKGKNPAAVELGRMGGKKGGKARAAKLSAEQRSAIAKKAADARWRTKNG
jgi:hypothetical protein